MMRIFRKGAVISIIAAMLMSASVADAASSVVSVSTSDGANISLRSSSGDEVEKSIDELIVGTDGQTQPKKTISRVIAIRSENPDLNPTNIYIRLSAVKKSAIEKFNIEIADSKGVLASSTAVYEIEDEQGKKYIKDISLGSFNTTLVNETRMYTVIADSVDGVGMSIISGSGNSGNESEKEAVSTVKTVGEAAGKINPGSYRITTAKQIKVTAANGDVTLFKVSDTRDELLELKEGDSIEYYGRVYLKRDDTGEMQNGNMRYLPVRFNSMLYMFPGNHTEVLKGKIRVYDEDGKLMLMTKSDISAGSDAYVLNPGTLKKEKAATINLVSDIVYTVGTDIGVGDYIGTGEGILRVYDVSGYAKTVIRLKKGESSAEGVESYVFKLNEDETFIAEGEIEFKEAKASSDN